MNLNSKIQYLSGVGPKMAANLNKLGIETIDSLLFYYPRAYKDFTKITKIKNLRCREDCEFTISGKILEISNKKTSRRKFTITEAVVADDTSSIKVVWFNQPFLTKMLKPDKEVILNGKIKYNFYSKEIVMESPLRAMSPVIIPIYGETAGITSGYIRKLVFGVKDLVLDIPEWLPNDVLKKYDLLGIKESLLNIHFPKNSEMLENARRRIAFDELFLIALKANLSRFEIKKENAPRIETDNSEIAEFVKNLPFKLTDDQRKAAWQIIKDLDELSPMNRLLNGDVGSGKTVVAAIAAFAAIKAGFRVVIMAPTSILSVQHYETFCKLFKKNSKVSIGLYTSERQECSENANSKSEILKSDIIIGTQALIQKNVKLENIGLVIVDEQHRFGVAQRSTLQTLGVTNHCKPHFLSMTATPIPRTLHLALFGDLDLSVIREKPKDRKEIKTCFVKTQNREKAYEFIRKQIQSGRQAFVICPLIEAKDRETEILSQEELFAEEKKSVMAEFEKLQKVFPNFNVGMLHGKMKAKEKDNIMGQFSSGKLDVLVSTSVVEVGVDVPNATVMVIEDAEHFGLAQIHQFRGRVGRAEYQSYCFLFSSTMSLKALKRLKSLETTSDGFRLAEIDLETRGPGAIFGTEQSGLLDLKMANFSDQVLISQASTAAKEIIENDSDLKNYPLLKDKIANFLQNKHLE